MIREKNNDFLQLQKMLGHEKVVCTLYYEQICSYNSTVNKNVFLLETRFGCVTSQA